MSSRALPLQSGRAIDFKESMRAEMERQGDIKKKTKAEVRVDMCEQLGRGC